MYFTMLFYLFCLGFFFFVFCPFLFQCCSRVDGTSAKAGRHVHVHVHICTFTHTYICTVCTYIYVGTVCVDSSLWPLHYCSTVPLPGSDIHSMYPINTLSTSPCITMCHTPHHNDCHIASGKCFPYLESNKELQRTTLVTGVHWVFLNNSETPFFSW